MLLNLKELNLNITGVLQVGAHVGVEVSEYIAMGVPRVWCFEPCTAAFEQLSKIGGKGCELTFSNFALGDVSGPSKMYTETSNGGQSNSLLEPLLHTKHYPGIKFNGMENVEVKRMDELTGSLTGYNLLSMDVQGTELMVLRGFGELLHSIDYIITEVNKEELYNGCVMIDELDSFLKDFGFKRVATKWTDCGWGDSYYAK